MAEHASEHPFGEAAHAGSSLALLERVGGLDLQRAGAHAAPAQRSPGSSTRATTERTLLPAGIDDVRSRALMRLLTRLSALDLAPVLVYHVDTVPASALYALAWQFGVTGARGWDLADTEAKRRDLLRRAVELHRHAGTPWVIRQVLAAVGWPGARVDEGGARPAYDGAYRYDGSIDYGADVAWARFRVHLGDLAADAPFEAAHAERLEALIDAWKNARSELVELGVGVPLADDLTAPTDVDMAITLATYTDYDGSAHYDGRHSYGGALQALGAV